MEAKTLLGVIAMALGMMLVACQSSPPQGTSASSRASAQSAAAAPSSSAAGKVAQVVFIGKRKACDCTRTRIDETWIALEQVLDRHPEIQVKSLEADVDEQETNRYKKLKPLMTLPGVYLMDGSGTLIQMLQGELSVAQFEGAIGKPTAKPSG